MTSSLAMDDRRYAIRRHWRRLGSAETTICTGEGLEVRVGRSIGMEVEVSEGRCTGKIRRGRIRVR